MLMKRMLAAGVACLAMAGAVQAQETPNAAPGPMDQPRDWSATLVQDATGLHAVRFDCLDVQAPLSAQPGHVLLLDVLQYLDAGPQLALLRAASARVAAGGRLLLRTPLATGDGRDRTTRVADRLAWLVGWMGTRPRHYPDPHVLQATLAEAGLQVTAPRPLHGRTPFNSWLLVAQRPAL